MKRALDGLPGVQQAEVSFAKKQAVVRYELGTVDVAQMIEAIGKVGFAASLPR